MDNSYRSGGADESDAASAATAGSKPVWAPLRSTRPMGPDPPTLLGGLEIVTATALHSESASVVPAIRQSRPGCRQRRERTVTRGVVGPDRARGTVDRVFVRFGGGTRIVGGLLVKGCTSHLTSTMVRPASGATGPRFISVSRTSVRDGVPGQWTQLWVAPRWPLSQTTGATRITRVFCSCRGS